VIVEGQIVYPWKVLAAAKAAEGLGAAGIVIATPVAGSPPAIVFAPGSPLVFECAEGHAHRRR